MGCKWVAGRIKMQKIRAAAYQVAQGLRSAGPEGAAGPRDSLRPEMLFVVGASVLKGRLP